MTLTNRPTDPTAFSFLVASQDGTGAWTLAPAPTGDTYTFPVSSSEWGLAWTCIVPNGGRQVIEARFLTLERTSLTETISPACTDRSSMDVSATVTIPASAGGGYVQLYFGDRTVLIDSTNTVAISTPAGTYDLVVVHHGLGDLIADWAIVQRGVSITDGSAVSIQSPSAATQSFPVTVGSTGMPIVETHLVTANGTSAQMSGSTVAPFAAIELPATYALATDVYQQFIAVSSGSASESTESWTATLAAQTFAPPSPLGTVTATVPTSTPYPEVQATWTAYSGAIGYAWSASQTQTPTQCGGTSSCSVTWVASFSPGVAGSSPTFKMPDLSGLSGWTSSFQFVAGTLVQGAVTALTSSAGATDFPATAPAPAGTSRTRASSSYSTTP